MKKYILLTLLAILFSQPVLADNWFENMFSNKPKAYFGYVFSYSPVANSLGIAYLKAPLNSKTVSTTYVNQAFFTDKAFWVGKDLAQLGDYVIVTGTHHTILGREGIQPFYGINAYNFKYLSLNLGLGLYEVDELIAKHINLSYDFFLERASLDFVFMF